jgi:hypothetical protein
MFTRTEHDIKWVSLVRDKSHQPSGKRVLIMKILKRGEKNQYQNSSLLKHKNGKDEC